MANKKNYHAVVRGREPGIYNEWFGKNGAAHQVIRFPNPLHRGFATLKEAEEFMLNHCESKKPMQPKKDIIKRPFSKSPKNGQIIIYTDGACIKNPGPGGYGVVINHKTKRKELAGGYRLTTNNRMELMACIVALGELKKESSAILYSDSKYVVDSITKGWAKGWRAKGWIKSDKKPAINPDLWEKLLELYEKHNVDFEWVKGHAGIEENERCDELATKSASGNSLLIDEYYESNQ